MTIREVRLDGTMGEPYLAEPTINDIKRNIEETLGEDWCPDCVQPPHLCTCIPDTVYCGDHVVSIDECGCKP